MRGLCGFYARFQFLVSNDHGEDMRECFARFAWIPGARGQAVRLAVCLGGLAGGIQWPHIGFFDYRINKLPFWCKA